MLLGCVRKKRRQFGQNFLEICQLMYIKIFWHGGGSCQNKENKPILHMKPNSEPIWKMIWKNDLKEWFERAIWKSDLKEQFERMIWKNDLKESFERTI